MASPTSKTQNWLACFQGIILNHWENKLCCSIILLELDYGQSKVATCELHRSKFPSYTFNIINKENEQWPSLV